VAKKTDDKNFFSRKGRREISVFVALKISENQRNPWVRIFFHAEKAKEISEIVAN
jgi:hypothetical protein